MGAVMTFTKDFDTYATHGDFISCELPDGFAAHATLYYDADTKPDSETMPLAEFSAWANDEWQYVGVAVVIWRCGVKLTDDFNHALWGIDCNFPNGEKNRNWYLRQVANELLPDAVTAAKEKIKELCK